jgi:curved DNA-binding protein CbpA
MSNNNGAPDYYEVLQLNPNAEQLVITKVYRLLAANYHPDNKQTGDEEKFKKVLEAYEVLSDPAKRSRYDLNYSGKGIPKEPTKGEKRPGVSPELENLRARFTEKAGNLSDRDENMSERELRKTLLLALYDVRRNNPSRPQLPMLVLAELLGCRLEELEFSNWYLKEKGYIKITESADFSITIAGVDYVENELVNREAGRHYLSLPESKL